ncbi:MAG: hypothetical protein EA422_10430 [Gemmatimonadales bacterium]|nr:MAG: hypothetical protein EA422_10430 [Gemmatimonadales bacterium]
MLGTLFFLLAALVVVGGLLFRGRLRRRLDGRDPMTDDPLLRQILADSGAQRPEDAPLDEEAIREAEEEFWDQEWDQPEDWRG